MSCQNMLMKNPSTPSSLDIPWINTNTHDLYKNINRIKDRRLLLVLLAQSSFLQDLDRDRRPFIVQLIEE